MMVLIFMHLTSCILLYNISAIRAKYTQRRNIMKNKKTALITGASSGIGYELAEVFASHGIELVLCARSSERLEQARKDISGKYGIAARVITADLADPASPQNIYNEIVKNNIEIDVLVNNAGTQVYGHFKESDPEALAGMINVNLVSLTSLTGLFLPRMVKAGWGRVLNLGSTGSFVSGPLNAVYCATKAYVLSFSDAVGEELKGTGVKVTCLCPGATATGFAKSAGITGTRIFQSGAMKAEKVAMAGYHAMMKGQRIKIPGLGNKLMVLAVRFTPRAVIAPLSRYLMSIPLK
jgi:short-subunit dehydrogenase